jgi:hypothetical protein
VGEVVTVQLEGGEGNKAGGGRTHTINAAFSTLVHVSFVNSMEQHG